MTGWSLSMGRWYPVTRAVLECHECKWRVRGRWLQELLDAFDKHYGETHGILIID